MQVNTEDKATVSGYQEDARVRTQDNTHEIVSKVAYLIGVPREHFEAENEPFRWDLYKELDAITSEEQLQKFTEDLRDRFGEMPEQLVQLTYVVRLRREAIKLGFERIVMKNNVMLVYFVSNQQSLYYTTPVFANILNYINSQPKNMSVQEQNNKLLLKIKGIDTIEKGYDIVFKMKMSIFADW